MCFKRSNIYFETPFITFDEFLFHNNDYMQSKNKFERYTKEPRLQYSVLSGGN